MCVDCRSQVSEGKPGTPAEMAAAKADFNRLTEAASQLMDSGELDVYSLKQVYYISHQHILVTRIAERLAVC